MPGRPREKNAVSTASDRKKSGDTAGSYDYERFSQLAGGFIRPKRGPYKVQYRRLMNRRESFKTLAIVCLNVIIEVGFLLWLFRSEHINFSETDNLLNAGIWAILAGIIIIEGFRLINMFTLGRAALVAKQPVPVLPRRGKRVAFTTAIVPSKEPFSVVRNTLMRAKKIEYDGTIDVWLLDEGNDPDIKRACQAMGVHHFSRKDIEKYNQPSGGFKARTKHGNHNAWLDAHGNDYDFVLSVDGDHAPMPNFADRLLGYFRDPNVAFVVGPQVYGNFDNIVTKGAESQAYLFQAAIQRAGNTCDAAMFVGTNHAFRVKAWQQINGFQDSITEDMLTSMVIHSTKNPKTGKYWKSVYTPDVVAVGEGPTSWTDFFSQQLRWSRGSNEVLAKNYLKLLFKLPIRRAFHYSLMISYYPSVAISWVVGISVSMLYLVMGQTGIDIDGKIWLALYTDILVMQIVLYAWMRKYNVSPHEASGTVGLSGMVFSMVAAPIYVTSFTTTLMRRQAKFVVTPKGDSASPDRLWTFKKQLLWASIIIAFLTYSLTQGDNYTGVKIWSLLTLVVCALPIVMWQVGIWPERQARMRRNLRRLAKAFQFRETIKPLKATKE